MPLIDAYTLLGSWPRTELDLSVDALAAGMQSRAVGRSLVTHTTAIFYDAPLGNDQVLQLCKQFEPLTPVAVVNPLRYPRCIAEIERCQAAGVKVFRLCPREHGYPMSGQVGPLREVLRALEGASLLLADLIGLPQPAIAADLEDLLPVPTAVTVDGDTLGTALQVGKRGANLWIETSHLQAGGSIEAAVEHLGANRVVFGSGSPLLSIGAAVMTVQYAQLSDADRSLVFEGNVQRALA